MSFQSVLSHRLDNWDAFTKQRMLQDCECNVALWIMFLVTCRGAEIRMIGATLMVIALPGEYVHRVTPRNASWIWIVQGHHYNTFVRPLHILIFPGVVSLYTGHTGYRYRKYWFFVVVLGVVAKSVMCLFVFLSAYTRTLGQFLLWTSATQIYSPKKKLRKANSY